ncbi:MAG: hypothetical protein K2X81_15115, partial [Candidatus Obscuribacterales bacterium]|nr:hypothetical protein [Candidatus Obscuribacterales bacterium]
AYSANRKHLTTRLISLQVWGCCDALHEGTPYPNKTYAKPLDVLGNDTTIYSPFGGAPFEANTIQTYGSGSSSSSVGFALA